jgi:FlaA1/EpsC-like NDP-sugar epimerase
MKKKIIIIGAGIAGRLLESDIKHNYHNCEVVGFIDDISRANVKILGKIEEIKGVLDRYKVDEVVIAIPSAEGSLVRRILMININNRVPIRIVPREQRVIRHNDVQYKMVRDLTDEDWLGRPPVRTSINSLEKYYKNKIVLVTGGAGSIGSEIVRQLLELKVKKVVVMDNSEFLVYGLEQELKEAKVKKAKYELMMGSVVDRTRTEEIIKKVKPRIVFHAAAYKHVHLMEKYVGEAIKTNVLGTKNVADAATRYGVEKFVQVSTDKAVNPASVMGATKKIAEMYVRQRRSKVTSFSIVRFGNVINSQGSVLPLFSRQVLERREVTVTDKRMERYFMSIREAAQLVIMSATRMTQGAIYVLNMGDLISVNEVAKCVIRSHNLIPDKDVKIKMVGQRPGEKMVEELFAKEEIKLVRKTSLPNIWRLQNGITVSEHNNEVISNLQHMVEKPNNNYRIIALLRTMFPTLR